MPGGQDETLPSTQDDGAHEPAALPAQLGRFRVEHVLGAGGMGVVLAARDPDLDRPVAIKLLRGRPWSKDMAGVARARLEREARAMARINHPNVVTVYEVGGGDDSTYIAMELVDGQTARSWLKEKPRRWREILALYRQAGEGLAAAHRAELVHRDFKPDNVLVGRDGRVRVADFGIAGAAAAAEANLPTPGSSSGLSSAAGTLGFASPEQMRGDPLDARTDQFSFCASLYHALHGVVPFPGKGVVEILDAMQAGPARPATSDVPEWLRKVVVRGLALAPEQRFTSMDELLAALAHDPARRRRRIALVAGVLLVGGAVGVAASTWRHGGDPCASAAQLLEGAWDPTVRTRVEAAFTATGVGFAGDAFQRTAGRLDDYAVDWRTRRVQACRATRVRGEQPAALLEQRVACLDRRREAVAALTTILARADADLAADAVRLVGQLPPVAVCDDLASLRRVDALPSDPVAARVIAAVDADLAALDVGRQALSGSATVDAGSALVARADATGFRPLQARAHLLLGQLHAYSGDPAVAASEMQAAADHAAAAHDDRLFVTALSALAFTRVREGQAVGEGLLAANLAEATAVRQDLGPLPLAAARHAKCGALSALGKLDEALTLRATVIATYEQELGKDSPRLFPVLLDQAIDMNAAGRPGDARAWAERALAASQAAYGPDNPNVGAALSQLGTIARLAGDLPRALELHERALALFTRSYGEETGPVANILHDVAIVYFEMGDLAAAETRWQRAMAIGEKVFGAEHVEMTKFMASLAQLRGVQGRYDEGLALAGKALAIASKVYGEGSVAALDFTDTVGILYWQMGRFAEARTVLARELALREKLAGTASTDYATNLATLARAEAADGHCELARPRLDEAERIILKALGAESPILQGTLEVRADCLLADRRPGEAVALYERSIALARAGGLEPHTWASTRLGLARALWDSGQDRARARREAREALASLDGHESADDEKARAGLGAWLAAHR